MEIEIEEDICSICYETFEKQSWILECNHKFHTECIMKWFRNDNSSCPLCNHSIQYENLSCWEKLHTIKEIKKLGRRKNCPIKIKKILNKIKKVQQEQNLYKIKLKEFKNKYNKQIKEYLFLSRKLIKFVRKIRIIERQLQKFITINPIYVYKKK